MLQKLTLLYFLIFFADSYGQIQATTINSVTKKPVPFVNIRIENENTGTTSNANGEFTLSKFEGTKTLIFSSVGYETKKVESGSIGTFVAMTPQTIALKEVVVRNSKKRGREKVVGKIKMHKIGNYLPGTEKPRMYARFFNYSKEYDQTPYLKKIKIATESALNDTKFNIVLLGPNERGEPGGFIYNKKLTAFAKQGKSITELDISDLLINFPENGFFVAVEWLTIDVNKAVFGTIQPDIGFLQMDSNSDSWWYSNGQWKKIWLNGGSYKYYKNKYNLMAMELVLSN